MYRLTVVFGSPFEVNIGGIMDWYVEEITDDWPWALGRVENGVQDGAYSIPRVPTVGLRWREW